METWTYWKRWGGEPLHVIQVFRLEPGGRAQTWHEDGWADVPGDYLSRAAYLGDAMMDRITRLEAVALTVGDRT